MLAALQDQTTRLAIAFDNITQGVCFFDADLRLIMSNRRYAEIYGLAPEQMRAGMTLREILALRAEQDAVPAMTPEQYIAWTQAETSTDVPADKVVELRNGRVVTIRHRPMSGGGYVATHDDITERRIAEAALRHGEKLRALGQLTGGIAHDLNNLLFLVSANLERVLNEPDDGERVRKSVQVAQRSLGAAADLLGRMVNFASSQPPQLQPTDLNAWLMPLRELAARLLGRSFLVELKADPRLPAWPVDRSQLESALINLILNARDVMPEGGGIKLLTEAVTLPACVAAELDVPAGDYVAISVQDTGPGMPPEVAARAFDPFFTTKPAGSGTGLGLSMVRAFARQAGGTATLTSSPGSGTTVRILLPAG